MTSHVLILGSSDKLPAPRPGIEVVALGAGDPIALKGSRGLTISERLFGKYRTFVEVDISEKSYTKCSKLPSKATTMFFDATVQVSYRVTDPAQLVKRAVDDGLIATWRLLEPAMQKSTRNADGALVADAEALAEKAAQDVCQKVKDLRELGIEISAVAVSLQLEARTRELLDVVERETLISRNLDANQRLDTQKRRANEEMLQEGPRAWLAHLMRDDPHVIREVLNQMAMTDKERYENDFKLLIKMLDSGEIESHEIPKNVKEDFIQSVLQRTRANDALQLLKTEPKTLMKQEAQPADSGPG
jgi:hypothetical protein